MSLLIQAEPIPLAADADGVMRVGGTRVTLETVVGAFKDGASAEEIVARFDVLTLADVYAVLGYYLRHTAEVEAYLRQRDEQAAELRQRIGGHSASPGIRERLIARRDRRG